MTEPSWLTLISLAVAGITAYFLIRNSRMQREQIKLMEHEIETRLRPWLGREDVVLESYTTEDDKNLTEKELKNLNSEKAEIVLKDVRFDIIVKNYGLLPAQNVSVTSKWQTDKIPTKNDLEPDQFGLRGMIMPDEKIRHRTTVDALTYKKAMNGEITLYLIVRSEYEYKGKSGYYQAIARVERNVGLKSVSSEAG